MAEERKIESLP